MNTLRKKLLTAAAIAGLGLTTIAFAGRGAGIARWVMARCAAAMDHSGWK